MGGTCDHIRIQLPIRVLNLANQREHWATRKRREDIANRALVPVLRAALRRDGQPAFPVMVTLTRIAHRSLDSHDGLPIAFKSTVDAVAKLLGLDDADPRVSWRYAQRKATAEDDVVRGYGVEVVIEASGQAPGREARS